MTNANSYEAMAREAQQATPDITLAGATVDRMVAYLTNPTILAKGQDGNMHPFVDPGPILAALREAALAELAKRSQGAGAGTIADQPAAGSA